MRIRIIKMFYYDGHNHYHAGDVVDVPESVAKPWLRDGLAMQDKSLDGPSETKVEPYLVCMADVEPVPREKPVTTAPPPLRSLPPDIATQKPKKKRKR